MCGKKITCDNLYVKSLTRTQPQTPSQRNWIAESRHAIPGMLVRDRFGHQHRLSDYIGPSIPSGLISHKDARMPRESVRKELQCRDSGFVQSILRLDCRP